MSFSCPVCNKTFSQSRYLKAHMNVHTGEKSFVCPDCKKAFVNKSNWKRHSRIHTGDKPFICTECNEAFTQTSHLTTHMKRHTGEKPFVCPDCSKAFSHIWNFEAHLRYHTDEKPFVCADCNQAFSKKTYLVRHMRCHSGEMLFTCANCNKAFSQKTYLTKHMKRHTVDGSNGVGGNHGSIERQHAAVSPTTFNKDVSSTTEFLVHLSLEGKFTFVDSRVTPVLGYIPQELLGQGVLEYCHPEDQQQLKETFEQVVNGKDHMTCVISRCLHMNKDYVSLRMNCKTFLNPYSDEVEYILCTCSKTSTFSLQVAPDLNMTPETLNAYPADISNSNESVSHSVNNLPWTVLIWSGSFFGPRWSTPDNVLSAQNDGELFD